jgi:hypothetical protein
MARLANLAWSDSFFADSINMTALTDRYQNDVQPTRLPWEFGSSFRTWTNIPPRCIHTAGNKKVVGLCSNIIAQCVFFDKAPHHLDMLV